MEDRNNGKAGATRKLGRLESRHGGKAGFIGRRETLEAGKAEKREKGAIRSLNQLEEWKYEKAGTVRNTEQ